MASLKASYRYPAILGLVLVLTQCSVEKNTETTRFFHSLTARYNIYFNGLESYKAGIARINDNYQDDYGQLLNVFESSDPTTATMCSSDMERAIQKASKLITLKSITAKPEIKNNGDLTEKQKELLERKEFNEWVDDSYLLVGKARFHKHEFDEAESVFNYCIAEANDPLIKKEATIWLARINNEKKNYSESNRLLNELEITPDLGKSMRAFYYSTMADLFIKQKRYEEAIEPLTTAIDLVSGKRPKYRLTYLLAQLYEQTGNSERATVEYQAVVNMNPPYDVEFNARINIAGVFDVNSGDPREIRKQLERMLRDSKNTEFQDQIYFALGNLLMKEGNEAEAIKYYLESAAASTGNQNQKGRSYLALADHFYNKPDFMKAGMYYDSALFFIDQTYPGYTELEAKSSNLNSLVSQLTVIQEEDSLQRVASLSEGERSALITSIIDKINKAESEGKVSEYSDRYNLGQFYENERRFQGNIEQEGRWYFYNQSALTFGRTEFRRRWGQRKLEDNWRRSNRTRSATQTQGGPEEANGKTADTTAAELDYKKPEFYLKNLPLNDSLLRISDEKIATALMNAGTAYAEKIRDPEKATETWESLIARFPENELVPEALYKLYNLNKEINSAKSEAYRQRLLEKYPNNDFARIISDPAYFEKKMAALKIVENLYENAYNEYSSENFGNAIALIDTALARYPQDALSPKFMLLRAYCTARTSDERSFRQELQKVSETWPGSDESQKASEMIAYLDNKMPELKIEEDKKVATELYVADTISKQIFVLIIPDPKFNINLATFDVISYNIDNYTNSNYKTEGVQVENKYLMITVSGFTGYASAFRYYTDFQTEKIVRNSAALKITKFIISEPNLKVLSGDMNPGRYLLFFNENYLK